MKDAELNNIFENSHAICLASDDNYSKYLYVTLTSIVKNSSEKNFYDIVILSSGINSKNRDMFQNLSKSNISIRFFDMNKYVEKEIFNSFFISGHVSKACYFRIFIPKIFKNYKRVLYIDCDVVLDDDINKVFGFDMNGAMLGVVQDADCYIYEESRKIYMKNILNIEHEHYFCSGVILYNIPVAIAENLTETCLDALNRIKEPMFHDQDILNAATFGKNCYLSMEWHYQTWLWTYHDVNKLIEINSEYYGRYMDKCKQAKLIHYGGGNKPWMFPDSALAHIWWKYARMTPYYELFIMDKVSTFVRNEITRTAPVNIFYFKIKYVFYKVLSYCHLGALSKKMGQRAEKTRKKLRGA